MLPRRLYVQCPLCSETLEAVVQDFTLGMCEDDEEQAGIGLQIGAFVAHECGD